METYCLRLTEALARIEPIDILALRGRDNGMPPGIMALLAFPFTLLRHLLRRKSTPRVMHLGDMALWPLGLLRKASTRLVISAHGTDVAYHRRAGLRGRLYGAYLRLGAGLLPGAVIIANSRATAQVLAETGWTASTVIPLATDFAADTAAQDHDGSILFAGRLVRRKGCGWFIANVLPLLPASITLKIAGTKWDAQETAALDNPRVQFLGPLEQQALARHYAGALCVIVPNIDLPNGEYEGFGLVAPEAASAGGVVLAARSGGLCDAVLDGETGMLLESGDAQAWADAIVRIASWDAGQRGEFTTKAQENARNFYNWGRVAEQTAAAYFD